MSIRLFANLITSLSLVYVQTVVFLFLKIFVEPDLAADFVVANAFMAPLYMLGAMNLRMVFLVLEKNNENLIIFQAWKLLCGIIILCVSFLYLKPTSSIISCFIAIRFIDSLQELNYVYYLKNNLFKINLLLVTSKLVLFTILLFLAYIFDWFFFPLYYLLLTLAFFVADFFFINFRLYYSNWRWNILSFASLIKNNYVFSLNSFSNSVFSNAPRYLLSTNSNLLNVFHSYSIIPMAFAYLTSAFQDFILIDYNSGIDSVRRRFIHLILFTLFANIVSFIFVFYFGKYFFGIIDTNPAELIILFAALLFLLFKQVESSILGLLFAKNMKYLILFYLLFCISIFALLFLVFGYQPVLILNILTVVSFAALLTTFKYSGLYKGEN